MSVKNDSPRIPWFGARNIARTLMAENQKLRIDQDTFRTERDQMRTQRDEMREKLERFGAMTAVELEFRHTELERQVAEQRARLEQERVTATTEVSGLKARRDELQNAIVATEDIALLQESGIYHYRHPLTDVVAYEHALEEIESEIKAMARKDGGAVLAATNWTVNGSASEGRVMVRDFSKLMLRAFNAEADNLVRGLKPYKVDAAIARLSKVSETIERLGKTMHIRIAPRYLQVRVSELELTADFLQKQAEEKEAERLERERMREERKVQQEIERERLRLEKERQHYSNAIEVLIAKGDAAGAARLRNAIQDVERAIAEVDYRAANIRAGYVYVISNIGSFGESMVKIGMTRRLDPLDRIRELSDASVPFNFDVHALFFSKDAVGIETEMHQRLAQCRINVVNFRREFFRATPLDVKHHLAELAGELLQFKDVPDAIEYRQCLKVQSAHK